MIGVVVLLSGCIAITLSVIDATAPGGTGAFWAGFLRSPRAWGLIIGLAGFIVTTMGVVRAKVGSAAAPGAYNKVVEAEFRVGGVFAAATGVAMLLIAALLIFAPGVLQGMLASLREKIIRKISP